MRSVGDADHACRPAAGRGNGRGPRVSTSATRRMRLPRGGQRHGRHDGEVPAREIVRAMTAERMAPSAVGRIGGDNARGSREGASRRRAPDVRWRDGQMRRHEAGIMRHEPGSGQSGRRLSKRGDGMAGRGIQIRRDKVSASRGKCQTSVHILASEASNSGALLAKWLGRRRMSRPPSRQ